MSRTKLIAARNMFLFFTILAYLAGCGSSNDSDLTANTILVQMKEAYANCATYQDTGVVTTTFIQSSGNWTDEKPFSTAFERPDRFRFEYKETQSSTEHLNIIWRNGAVNLSWWDIIPGIRAEDSLDMTIAGATGVSGSSAHTIPALLLPDEISGRQLTDITESQRIDNAAIDGVNCYRIQGKFAGDPMTIWIEATTFLVRRIETQHTFSNFRTETVTTYSPILNGAITDDILAFNPPLGVAIDDRIRIINITPASATANQNTTFNVEVSYNLSSKDSGVLSVGFNDTDAYSYHMFSDQDFIVSKGSGTHTFIVTTTPVNWGANGSFRAYVSLSENPQSISLAYYVRFFCIGP